MRILDEIEGRGEENPLVPLALGVLSSLESVLRRLEEEGGASAEVPSTGGVTAGPALEQNDPFVLATLGLLSVARTARRWLTLAALEAAPATPETPAAEPSPFSRGAGWLR